MVHIRFLGVPAVASADGEAAPDDADWVALPPLGAACLAYLVLEGRGGPVARETLAGLLWRGNVAGSARTRLRQLVATLRKTCGPEAVSSTSKDFLRVDLGAVVCDVTLFEEAVEEGRFAEALAHHQGPLFGDTPPAATVDFEHWLEAERRRLANLACDAHWRLAIALEAEGKTRRALRHARAGVALSPYDERGIRELVRMLFDAGDAAAALFEYRRFETMMREEFDADPSPESVALVERYRSGRTRRGSRAFTAS